MAMTTKQRDDLDKAALATIEKLQAENAALRQVVTTLGGKAPTTELQRAYADRLAHPGGAKDITHLITPAHAAHGLRKAKETVARKTRGIEHDPHNRRVRALGAEIKKDAAAGKHTSLEELRKRAGQR